jgi:5-methylcytosine-specific restriction enzyme A
MEFYSSPMWRRVREQQLASEPFCRSCRAAGRMTPADMVDHIKPIKEGGDPYDSANLQSICKSCHGEKQIREGSRFKPRRPGGA